MKHETVILNYAGTPDDQFTWYGEVFHSAGSALLQELTNSGPSGVMADPDSS